MPELPEVETIKRDLEKKILGLKVEQVQVIDDRVIQHRSAQSFKKGFKNRVFSSIMRRGKGIVITLDNGLHLFVQVKMTGHLIYGEKLSTKETKVIFALSNGKYLNYNDQRLFGWLYLVDDLSKISYLNTIGPEPLEKDFNPDWLKKQLKKRTSPIKPLLMNQNFVAGIGNIYASEILYSAKISPKRRANRLTNKQIDNLYKSTVEILDEAIKLRGTSMRNYLDSEGKKGSFMNRIKVYGKHNEPCPTCKKSVIRIVQAQRSTFYCNKCQT